MPLKKYDKDLDYSYTYGVFPTLDLFKYQVDKIKRVVLNTKGSHNEGYRELEQLCKKHSIPLEYNTKAIMNISAKENTYAIGVFKKYQIKLNPTENHVVLVNPSNTGNLGTIIRAMSGFGFNNLAIIKPAVDIFDPKVVRSSMGSIFNINFEHFDSFNDYLKANNSNRAVYSFMLGANKELSEVKFENPFSLVFGNESQGLPNDYRKYGESVYIRHNKDIDSLNLAIATSIALYQCSKAIR